MGLFKSKEEKEKKILARTEHALYELANQCAIEAQKKLTEIINGCVIRTDEIAALQELHKATHGDRGDVAIVKLKEDLCKPSDFKDSCGYYLYLDILCRRLRESDTKELTLESLVNLESTDPVCFRVRDCFIKVFPTPSKPETPPYKTAAEIASTALFSVSVFTVWTLYGSTAK